MQSTLRELEENACCPHCGHNVYLNFILKRSRRCPNCQSAYRLEMDLQYVVATAACVIIAVVMLLSLTSGVVKVIALLMSLGLLAVSHYLAFLANGFRFVDDPRA